MTLLATLQHIVAVLLIMLTVLAVHYEVLNNMSAHLPRLGTSRRTKVLSAVIGCLVAHMLEILIFAVAYYIAERLGNGALVGTLTHSFEDYLYFSAATFTTVGYGDLYVTGHLRWLAGVESLTGFVLITWTASFLFLEMTETWRPHR